MWLPANAAEEVEEETNLLIAKLSELVNSPLCQQTGEILGKMQVIHTCQEKGADLRFNKAYSRTRFLNVDREASHFMAATNVVKPGRDMTAMGMFCTSLRRPLLEPVAQVFFGFSADIKGSKTRGDAQGSRLDTQHNACDKNLVNSSILSGLYENKFLRSAEK